MGNKGAQAKRKGPAASKRGNNSERSRENDFVSIGNEDLVPVSGAGGAVLSTKKRLATTGAKTERPHHHARAGANELNGMGASTPIRAWELSELHDSSTRQVE
jgi:hypothetical protein